MKRTFTFGLLAIFSIIAISLTRDEFVDTYTVIKVDGAITYEKNGKDMTRGDKFAENEKLNFKTDASRAAVISKIKGRFVLTPKKSNTSRSNLLPAMSNISSRKGEILNSVDMKAYFNKNVLLLEKSEVKIMVKDYPQDEDNFFYLMFDHNGESVAKKLNFSGNDVILERDSIFRVDGKAIEVKTSTPVVLYHRNASEKKSIKISEFNLVAPNLKDLVAELKIVKEEDNDKDFLPDARAYLTEFYGKVDADELSMWLKSQRL